MKAHSKLKLNRAVLPGIIMIMIAVIYMIVTIVEDNLWGTHFTAWFYGAAIILFCWIFAYKTRFFSKQFSLSMLAMGLVVGTAAWHYELAMHMQTIFSRQNFSISAQSLARSKPGCCYAGYAPLR